MNCLLFGVCSKSEAFQTKHFIFLASMSNVIEVNGDLSQWVNPREKRLVVIDFFATWCAYIASLTSRCGPCKYMHPIFDEFSVRYKNVVFLRVDSDKNRHLSGEYGVTGLPTFVFVLQGAEVDRVTGANPNAVEQIIQKYESAGNGFQGKGMALGGSSSTSANAREMRLKKFGNMKMSAANTSSHMSRMLNKMLSKEDSDGDEEAAEEEDKKASSRSYAFRVGLTWQFGIDRFSARHASFHGFHRRPGRPGFPGFPIPSRRCANAIPAI